MVLLVSPFRALTGSGSPPSKSLGEERECSVAWPIFFFFFFYVSYVMCESMCVLCEQLTQIQSDPYFGSKNSW